MRKADCVSKELLIHETWKLHQQFYLWPPVWDAFWFQVRKGRGEGDEFDEKHKKYAMLSGSNLEFVKFQQLFLGKKRHKVSLETTFKYETPYL